MRTLDLLRFAAQSVRAGRLRTRLTALGIAVGVAAVVLLTAIGEGVHAFVLGQFTQFGTNIVGVTPGQTRTHGVPGGIVGSVRPLTVADAEALQTLPQVLAAMPVVTGNAQIRANARTRRVTVIGVTADAPRVWKYGAAVGTFLPRELGVPRALAVLGPKARAQLFGALNPLGARIEIGGERYTVIGVSESKGQYLGFDLDDTVYVPVERALAMFNREGVVELDVLTELDAATDRVAAAIKRVLTARHGKEDFTVITQQQMLDTLGTVLDVLTFAVAALGGISLLVGGVGVLTIMTIAVRERVAEIGLLRALGARSPQVLGLFLLEAVMLAGLGGILGLLLGGGGALALTTFAPMVPVKVSALYATLAEVVACGIGLLGGAVPAWTAARLDPIEALRTE
ncbi:MAG: ABC transporter permease [Planctomycetota bacterium]